MAPRSLEQRKSDTLALLTNGEDAWIATAGEAGAHLVPLSFWWDGEVVTMTTSAETATVRNLASGRGARIAVGGTRDVVMIDGPVEIVPIDEAPESLRTGFVEARGWDPAWNDGQWVFVRVRPERVQAWREADEIDGRTIMRDGQWLG